MLGEELIACLTAAFALIGLLPLTWLVLFAEGLPEIFACESVMAFEAAITVSSNVFLKPPELVRGCIAIFGRTASLIWTGAITTFQLQITLQIPARGGEIEERIRALKTKDLRG